VAVAFAPAVSSLELGLSVEPHAATVPQHASRANGPASLLHVIPIPPLMVCFSVIARP
jgi:hypothetical protein